MSTWIKFGPSLPTVEIPESSRAPDWQQARPRAIARALERALARPHGNWYVVGESRLLGETPRRLRIAGEDLVAWRVDGELTIAPDACPHMGASLSTGDLGRGMVVCDRHLWAFRLSDGACPDTPHLRATTHEVRVEGDEIQVRLSR